MENTALLEASLKELFEEASSWNGGIVEHQAVGIDSDVREIRTDLTTLLGNRPSGKVFM